MSETRQAGIIISVIIHDTWALGITRMEKYANN
jgi:hypothetical protein